MDGRNWRAKHAGFFMWPISAHFREKLIEINSMDLGMNHGRLSNNILRSVFAFRYVNFIA